MKLNEVFNHSLAPDLSIGLDYILFHSTKVHFINVPWCEGRNNTHVSFNYVTTSLLGCRVCACVWAVVETEIFVAPSSFTCLLVIQNVMQILVQAQLLLTAKGIRMLSNVTIKSDLEINVLIK